MTLPPTQTQTWGNDVRLPCLKPPYPTNLMEVIQSVYLPNPTPLQSSHLPALKRYIWFVLKRPVDNAKTGLLIVTEYGCFFVSQQKHKASQYKIAHIKIRIDPHYCKDGVTVFAASISTHLRQLWIEDTLVFKGTAVIKTETFSKRWERAVQWLEYSCIIEPTSTIPLEIKLACWSPLLNMEPTGSWYIQSDTVGGKKFIWRAELPPVLINNHKEAIPSVPAITEDDSNSNKVLVALATKDKLPEQWFLTTGKDEPLGRALIRTLAISDLMRPHIHPMRVQVVWNNSFLKWEILGVTSLPLVQSVEQFNKHKS
jgi:hypothetical protein